MTELSTGSGSESSTGKSALSLALPNFFTRPRKCSKSVGFSCPAAFLVGPHRGRSRGTLRSKFPLKTAPRAVLFRSNFAPDCARGLVR